MLDKDIVVSVKNLGKSYRIWKDPSARLKAPLFHALNRMTKPFFKNAKSAESEESDGRIYNRNRFFQDFQALKGVDLELRKGESIGIIGRNGSGKSTLLQMIAGTLTPTEGTVETQGRVAALLELGAGFNDEFTGRENVYMNGAILGLTRTQIDRRFGKIVEFANIGEFIDQPIKTYSSGMRVRLAFAVQAEVDPDILIVDEALAVGDIRFTMKCIRRMRELVDNGTTLIFVSHDLSSIVNFCEEVIWIHDGELFRRGDPKTVTVEYSNFMHYGQLTSIVDSEPDGDSKTTQGSEAQSLIERNHCVKNGDLPDDLNWVDLRGFPSDGHGGVHFLEAALYCSETPSNNSVFEGGENIEVYLHLVANTDLDSPQICCDIYNSKGTLIYGVNSCFVPSDLKPLQTGDQIILKFGFELQKLQHGNYVILFGCSNGTYENHRHEFGVAEALTFEVKSSTYSQRHHVISFDHKKIETIAVVSKEEK